MANIQVRASDLRAFLNGVSSSTPAAVTAASAATPAAAAAAPVAVIKKAQSSVSTFALIHFSLSSATTSMCI
jgi:hypothetical protein